MTRIHQQVRRTIKRHHLLPAGSRIVIGLSGGSDSVALTLLLRDLAQYGEFAIAALAHLNHRIRPTADRDEEFSRALAARLELPVIMEKTDVKSYAAANRLSLEDAARRLRYDFLGRVAADTAAERIAVGHTQDDQAETFLLKLMRGAGLTGLGGIYPRRDYLIRPLLDVSRADLRTFLAARGESWVEDETNENVENPRNRVRHVVLPELDRAAGGPTRPALARAATLVREDGVWLDEVARARFEALAVPAGDGVEIDRSSVLAEPPPIQRRVLLQALRQVAGGREVGLDHIETVLTILTGNGGGADLPGSRVELRRGKLVLLRQKAD